MKRKQSKHPIGATWEYIDPITKMKYWIELQRMHGDMEVWGFGNIYSDGSGSNCDWTTSYNSAKRNQNTHGRFKRVKK